MTGIPDFREEIPAEPRITAETVSYLTVYKPPRMHTAPKGKNQKKKNPPCLSNPEAEETLFDWLLARFPEIAAVRGYRENEGGLLHRLDYETRGLVLIARTQEAWNKLAAQQEDGKFIKEYEAFSLGAEKRLQGFPPFPAEYKTAFTGKGGAETVPLSIESAFRPYGPGAKQVRPVTSLHSGEAFGTGEFLGTAKKIYRTTGNMESIEQGCFFRLYLTKGFRHQIRCHLAWAARPLVNDTLYGGVKDASLFYGFLALRASALLFTDPVSGKSIKQTST